MDFGQAALTVARRNEGVTISLFAAETDFTPDLIFFRFLGFFYEFLGLENPICVVEVIGISDRKGFRVILHLDDHVLDSSHFNDVSGFCVNLNLLRGNPSEVLVSGLAYRITL